MAGGESRIHVLLDTTAYRADATRRGASFEALQRLSEGGELSLHIPEVVAREHISQQQERNNILVRESLSRLKKLKKALGHSDLVDHVNQCVDLLQALDGPSSESVEEKFYEWAARMQAEIHSVHETHGRRVMDAYFAGDVPFKKAKERSDIPDAFIWQIALDLLEAHQTIFLVSADKAMRSAAGSHDRIKAFATLSDFIRSDPCREALHRFFETKNTDAFVHVICQETQFISDAIANSLVDSLTDGFLYSSDEPYEPLCGEETSASGVGTPTHLEIETELIELYGDGRFIVPFSLRVDCLLSYSLYKSDLSELLEDQSDVSYSVLNDHYYEVESEETLRVRGQLSIEAKEGALESDEEHQRKQLIEVLQEADIAIDSLDEIEMLFPADEN